MAERVRIPKTRSGELIVQVDIPLPDLPAGLNGLRIAHVTDVHVRKPSRRHARIVGLLACRQIDLLLLTGDYMHAPGHEEAALGVMKRICEAVKPRLGIFGSFGNHDTLELRDRLQDLPVTWLCNVGQRIKDAPIDLLGLDADRLGRGDSAALLAQWREFAGNRTTGSAYVPPRPVASSAPGAARPIGSRAGSRSGPRAQSSSTHALASAAPPMRPSAQHHSADRRLRLMLCHYPTEIAAAADLGVDLMFSGHTHGGQWRLPGKGPMYNASDLPLDLTCGLLRHRNTLCAVSRGLGEALIPIRLFCPPQLPIYTLRRGPLPGQATEQIVNVRPW